MYPLKSRNYLLRRPGKIDSKHSSYYKKSAEKVQKDGKSVSSSCSYTAVPYAGNSNFRSGTIMGASPLVLEADQRCGTVSGGNVLCTAAFVDAFEAE